MSETLNPNVDENQFIEKVQNSYLKIRTPRNKNLDFFNRMTADIERRNYKQRAVQEAPKYF